MMIGTNVQACEQSREQSYDLEKLQGFETVTLSIILSPAHGCGESLMTNDVSEGRPHVANRQVDRWRSVKMCSRNPAGVRCIM